MFAIRSIAMLAAVLSFSPGCATVISGTTQDVTVASAPIGADVIVDGVHVGKTPTTLKLKRKDDHLVTLEMSQYQAKSIAVVRNVNFVRTGAEDFFFLLSFPVDAYFGAEYDLIPAAVFLYLDPADAVPAQTDEQAAFVAQLKALNGRRASKEISDQEYSQQRIALMRKYMPEALPEASRQTPAVQDPPAPE